MMIFDPVQQGASQAVEWHIMESGACRQKDSAWPISLNKPGWIISRQRPPYAFIQSALWCRQDDEFQRCVPSECTMTQTHFWQ